MTLNDLKSINISGCFFFKENHTNIIKHLLIQKTFWEQTRHVSQISVFLNTFRHSCFYYLHAGISV